MELLKSVIITLYVPFGENCIKLFGYRKFCANKFLPGFFPFRILLFSKTTFSAIKQSKLILNIEKWRLYISKEYKPFNTFPQRIGSWYLSTLELNILRFNKHIMRLIIWRKLYNELHLLTIRLQKVFWLGIERSIVGTVVW